MTQTHTDGFTLVKPVLTTKKLVALIEELEAAYAKEIHDGVYKFRPEPISEGGIEFVTFPGKCKSMVKALRFEFGYDLNLSWPLISDNTFEQWKNDKEDHQLSNVSIRASVDLSCISLFHYPSLH